MRKSELIRRPGREVVRKPRKNRVLRKSDLQR